MNFNLFDWVIFILAGLHLVAWGLFWLLVQYPHQRLKVRLEWLEHEETSIRPRHQHNGQAIKKIHDEVAEARRSKRLKWKQKAGLKRLYLSFILPISAGLLVLAYFVNKLF